MARKQARPNQGRTRTFHVEELCIKLSEALYPLMGRIKARDKALEDQLRRAAVSIGLKVMSVC